jgi:copper resistance protein D
MLFQVFDFLGSIFDAMLLGTQAWVIGGTIFAILLAAPLGEKKLLHRTLVWLSGGASAMIVAEALSLTGPLSELTGRMGFPLAEVVGADFVVWHGVGAVGALVMWLLARSSAALRRPVILVLPIILMLLASVMTSHAASRLDGRLVLGISHVLHVFAASVWVGGIPFLLLAISEGMSVSARGPVVRRFSSIAAIAVALLTVSAASLTITHVDSLAGLVGGEYGALVLVKIALFGCMLLLGLGNFFAGRAMDREGTSAVARLRSFAETELGIAAAVLLVAASIASQPPPIDLPNDLVTPAQMWLRASPTVWPHLWDPPVITEMSWSEVNHNVSGLFVFVMGLLALLYHTGRCAWAKHWPLVLLAFAWIVIRTDADSWPLGECSVFGCGGGDPEVIQHRLLTLLPMGFGIVEWMLRTGRLQKPALNYMFPLFCAVGGALLLIHNHQIGDVRERYLVEFTHLPMGLFGILAGWGRWLELRSDTQVKRLAGWVWPICLIMVGLLLLDYRES